MWPEWWGERARDGAPVPCAMCCAVGASVEGVGQDTCSWRTRRLWWPLGDVCLNHPSCWSWRDPPGHRQHRCLLHLGCWGACSKGQRAGAVGPQCPPPPTVGDSQAAKGWDASVTMCRKMCRRWPLKGRTEKSGPQRARHLPLVEQTWPGRCPHVCLGPGASPGGRVEDVTGGRWSQCPRVCEVSLHVCLLGFWAWS